MHANRVAKIQSVIFRELAEAISREVRDPRVRDLAVTSVTLDPEGRRAVVLVAPLSARGRSDESEDAASGSAPEESRAADLRGALKGLKSASGFLRARLARALDTRYVPELEFKEDRGYANLVRVQELLK